jgi:hypothetical protein
MPALDREHRSRFLRFRTELAGRSKVFQDFFSGGIVGR